MNKQRTKLGLTWRHFIIIIQNLFFGWVAILRVQSTLIYLPYFQKVKIQLVSFALQVQKTETEITLHYI